MIGIPKGAKKVFTGVIFDVYHWEQELYDGSFTTFEKLKRNNSTSVIGVTEDKKILIGMDEQPNRMPVVAALGGAVEPGEDALEAAKREFLEESGYESSDWELFRTDTPTDKIDWTIYTYIARGCKKVTEPKVQAGERVTIQAVDFEEFVDIVTAEGFREVEIGLAVFRMIKERTLEEFKKRLMQ
jgi:ADP-ribose pyrophosphatase